MATDTIAPAPKSSAPDFTLTIPPIGSLDDFRRWMLSDEFPERGKIDFHRGRLEIDMSPQSLGDHGEVVAALIATLFPIVRDGDLGSLSDHVTRVSLPTADLSCEPDIVFVSHESLESGRVRETPKADRPSTGVEFVGPPDLLVEVVSDSSFDKDVNRYRDAYERAGVNEYWVIDARGSEVVFDIFQFRDGRFVAADVDENGWRGSKVFGVSFRLTYRVGRRDRRIWSLERTA